jgi:hypothetical protein
MSSFNAHPVGSSQYGVVNHVDAFPIGILVQTVDLRDHRFRLEFGINGKSCNDHQNHA